MDSLKWSFVLLLIATSAISNQFFNETSLTIRVPALIVAFGLAALVAAQTVRGKRFINFLNEARTEARKVHWPSRQETARMTGVVFLFVTVVGIVLWFIDSLLLKLIAKLTGFGG